MNGVVQLYLDHVRAQIEKANFEALKALALAIEAQTKINITENGQVDTGFMRASVYSVWKDGSGYADAQAAASSSLTDQPREMAPAETLKEGAGAGVIVGANYAIYQEAMQSFLYAAAEDVAASAGGTAEAVYKREL